MEKQLITAIAALLVLSGCGSAAEPKEEYKRPTVEDAKEMLTTYFEEKGYEVIVEENVADYFAYWLTINSWELPGGGMTVSLAAEDDDPTLLRNFSMDIIEYASIDVFKTTDILCDRFKIHEICSDLVKMFSPSTGPNLTPEDERALMQQIVDQVATPSGGNMYNSQVIMECPFSTYFDYYNVSAYGSEWTLAFACWFDEKHGC